MIKKLALGLVVGIGLSSASVSGAESGTATRQGVIDAVQAWCDALLAISAAHMEGGDSRAVAIEVLDSAYNYGDGQKTLFKPTLAFGDDTFRLTKEGALAYFVGGDANFPDDSGFALKNWVKARFDVAGIITEGDLGIYMGNIYFTDKDGAETMVDKTFVFKFDGDGSFRILAHKSALPFVPSSE